MTGEGCVDVNSGVAADRTVGMAGTPNVLTLAILAMGGEGGGVLADWIVDLAEHSGYYAQKTSVPGVAQRTGATIYYCEIFPEAAAWAAGQEPVLALMPVQGQVDVVIASELMECGRAVQLGLVTPDRTTLITSTHRVYAIAEKAQMGDGRVDADRLVEAGRTAARAFVRCDFRQIAEDVGSVVSAPLFGALCATGVLPFSRNQYEEAIRRGGVGVDASLAAFAGGFAASQSTSAPQTSEPEVPRVGPRLEALAARVKERFPAASHAVLISGIQRLADYQDARYAAAYLDRLEGVRDVDARHGAGDYVLLREAARHLALWMSYEDGIRVAALKTRGTRFARVSQEVRAEREQLVQIQDYLHPQMSEITDILPVAVGRALMKSALARRVVARLTRKGMLVETTSLRGFLQLLAIASLRPMRRRSLRFQREQALMADWLSQIRAIAAADYALALEVAECPRLIKGYGETHERGSRNFAVVMGTLPDLRTRPDAAGRLKRLREAALADEDGEQLRRLLQELNSQASTVSAR
jgi:indolepyruvate ferredoxin oxidoreductase beta subunit